MNNKNYGFILIDKPVGPTSHDIVHQLRKITGEKKIGHAGTLDPFASGLLIAAIGRQATREIDKFVKLDKEYVATLHLGLVSSTFDPEGEIKKWSGDIKEKSIEEVKKSLQDFIGEQEQIPPMFSAKKIAGQRLYELARKGKTIDRQPARINIYEIELLKYEWPILEIRIRCSTGTYIRALANDIGLSLGCGAYLENLKRTSIGSHVIAKAVDIKDLTSANWSDFLFI